MTQETSESLSPFQQNEVSLPDITFLVAHVPDPDYVCKRRAEYPDVKEYIDGVVKGDQDQIDAYIAKCQAVKAKYPKPE